MEALSHHDAHAPGVESRDEGGLGVAAVVLDAVEVGESYTLQALHDKHPPGAKALVHLFVVVVVARMRFFRTSVCARTHTLTVVSERRR